MSGDTYVVTLKQGLVDKVGQFIENLISNSDSVLNIKGQLILEALSFVETITIQELNNKLLNSDDTIDTVLYTEVFDKNGEKQIVNQKFKLIKRMKSNRTVYEIRIDYTFDTYDNTKESWHFRTFFSNVPHEDDNFYIIVDYYEKSYLGGYNDKEIANASTNALIQKTANMKRNLIANKKLRDVYLDKTKF